MVGLSKEAEYMEMFERIDKEEDGEVYVREVVEFLRVLDNNLEQSNEVNLLFMNYKKEANNVLDFKKFKEIMDEIKGAGWTRFKPVDGQPMDEQDLKKVFKMVDMDGSGAISQLELKMAVKYLGKRYGISDLKTWRATMKEADNNKDGKLNYLEFQDAIKLAEKKMAEAGGE
eukprot:TRINITY_DN17528_c0_g1_i1.p1 TRINITY_DN17528_c0_g1~~TRINITY_DN17528_c0_g1_i1.p1  ORF type:complete len:172 (+),score=66.73 TRINITY_DN17528_c0_g1_i1:83-598(+)